MVNQRLRNALVAAEITQPQLAEKVGVDAKSVERWITQDRVPHATTRTRVSRVLGQDETYFWPALLGTEQSRNATESELVQIWPTRNTVPGEVWRSLFNQARAQIDVLVYAGGFLIEAYDLVEVIATKAAAEVNFRILLGDPRCEAVRQRGIEEGLPKLADRCQSSLEYLHEVVPLDGVQIRTHQTTLYASQFRFDDALLVNNHTYGSWAARSPVMHLRKVPGGQLFDYYAHAFDRVWQTGRTVV
jgi:transcriptional regulator with XRE-family HTH domain